MKSTIWITVLWALAATSQADERIWMNAKINGQDSHLIFDTGADRLILFKKGAERLGLEVTPAPEDSSAPAGEVALGKTAPCEVEFLSNHRRTSLGVVEMPGYLDMEADGVLGWGALRNNILRINAISLQAELLQEAPLPSLGWTEFRLRPDSGYLSLEVPHGQSPKGYLLVDTGFTGGVALPHERWELWKTMHRNAPMTLDSYYMPGAGLVVKEETWADKIDIGPLAVTEIPLMEANVAQLALGTYGYEASLGLAALKRLDFVVDGPRNLAFVRLRQSPPPPYEHNRLGAVFVPADSQNDKLVATVTSHSPAHEAGICNGDVLLKIGKLDTTKWRSDPSILPLSQFWAQPSRTKLDLTLERGAQTFKTTVMLRQILSPESNPASKPDPHS